MADASPDLSPRTSVDGPEAQAALQQAIAAGADAKVVSKLGKWGAYPARGGAVGPSNLIPCKTPLAAAILAGVRPPPVHALTLPALLTDAQSAGTPVGLVLNLTSGPPLYAADAAAAGVGDGPHCPVRYAHVPLIAKEFPTREELDAVRAALARAPLPPAAPFVALHCSYGFNRTGFVTVALLVELHGVPVRAALAAFAAARPPGVRHGRFVDELVRRYGGGGDVPRSLCDDDGGGGAPAVPRFLCDDDGAVSPRSAGGGSTTPRSGWRSTAVSFGRSGRPPYRNASGVSLDNESLAGGGDASVGGDARVARWPPLTEDGSPSPPPPPARGGRRQAACVVM